MKFSSVIFSLRRIYFAVSDVSCNSVTSSFNITSRLKFSAMPAEKKPFSRLPTNVVPVNYNLWLKPCLSSFTFDGKQAVKVQVSMHLSLCLTSLCFIVLLVKVTSWVCKSVICNAHIILMLLEVNMVEQTSFQSLL